ncbi:MAG: aldehyde ferredoxin oxidoreductase [Desulfobacterales bacterium]|nr:aldehyde ferredoxin oxidoreductase [Desulfobacterales bacterium]
MHGWTGHILHINLTRHDYHVESPEPDLYHRFIGGKGLGGYYLHQAGNLDWNHPDMPVSLFTGPLTATVAPTSGRLHLVSRSPLTGFVGDASVGGKLGTQLKRAGWDGVVITGKSPDPVGIEIRDRRIRFIPCDHLQGKDTREVYRAVAPKKAGMACIGPAAENGVRFASLTTDNHHSAGRTGLGLSFAAKNLKYFLAEGTGKVRVTDSPKLKEAREEIIRLTAASPALMGQYGFTCLGTGAVYDLMDNRRMMPTDNFRATRFEPAPKLNASAYAAAYAPKKYGCKGCHILCKKIGTRNKPGAAMPEFETMSHFTALINSRDIDLVVEANDLCNRLGMDTISAAATLACRREITGKDYTGKQVLSLLTDMAMNRGEGRTLKLGAAEYARTHGHPETAMAVKGLELPAYDPRGAYGMALAYALSTRGGCHLRAYPISHEIFRKPVATDRFSFNGKARIIKIAEDLNAVVDALVACKFTFFAAGLEEYAKAFTAVTGTPSSAQDLLAAGERIYFNERLINHTYGYGADADDLPARFFTESGSGGNGIRIPPLDRDAFLHTRETYYRIRGLDANGAPLPEKRKHLGLD